MGRPHPRRLSSGDPPGLGPRRHGDPALARRYPPRGLCRLRGRPPLAVRQDGPERGLAGLCPPGRPLDADRRAHAGRLLQPRGPGPRRGAPPAHLPTLCCSPLPTPGSESPYSPPRRPRPRAPGPGSRLAPRMPPRRSATPRPPSSSPRLHLAPRPALRPWPSRRAGRPRPCLRRSRALRPRPRPRGSGTLRPRPRPRTGNWRTSRNKWRPHEGATWGDRPPCGHGSEPPRLPWT